MFRRRHRVFSILSSGIKDRPSQLAHSAAHRFHPRVNNTPWFETLEDRVVPSVVFTVTNTSDSGPGSLRQAILNANASNQPALIDFRIPTSDPGFVDVDSNLPGGDAEPDAFVIRPTTALPALSNPNHRVAIDGRAQTLFTCDTHALGPEIILDGSLAGATPGLRLVGAQHQVVGVAIQNFNGPGIVIDGADQTVIGHSILGGAPGRGNAQDGVRLVGDADGNAIGGPIPWDVVKTNEHVDLTLNLAADGWLPRVADRDADTFTYGQRTLLFVPSQARTNRPAGTTWDFIGVGSGQTYWRLPQQQNPNLLYLGLGTQETSPSLVARYIPNDPRVPSNLAFRWMTLNLVDVRGPGHFSLWQNDDAGPIVWMASADGITTNDRAFITAGGHLHYNWGFTAPGYYEIDFRASAWIDVNGNGSVDPGVDIFSESCIITFAFGVETQAPPNSTNTLSHNAGAGVAITGTTALSNTIRFNSIHSNGGLGIDLGGNGVTPNDPGDNDTGPNGLQNFPTLNAVTTGSTTTIVGSLSSRPNTSYLIDFYANTVLDPTGFGEGTRWLGSSQVVTNAQGIASINVTLNTPTLANELVTATATGPDGTSEFSASVVPPAPNVELRFNGGVLNNGAAVTFGTTSLGTPVDRLFTIVNTGDANLVLNPSISLPNGFSILAGFGQTTLAPGASTSFTVRLNATTVGTFSGPMSFTSNDPDDSPFTVTLTGTVAPPPTPDVELRIAGVPIASGTGSVNFGTTTLGVPLSRVFTVINTGNANLVLNPSISLPNGFSILAGFGQTTLAPGASTSFTVRLNATTVGTFSGPMSFTSNDPDESPYVVTLTGVVNPTPTPDAELRLGTTVIPSGTGTVTFGPTTIGTPVDRLLTIVNTGNANLILNPTITVPSGFTLISGFGALILTPGASTSFTVRLNAQSAGTFSGPMSFTSNDPDESPYVVTLTGVVNSTPTQTPDIEVRLGTTVIANGSGPVSFGTTLVGSMVERTFTVFNRGNGPLQLGSPISLPTGYVLVSPFGQTTVAPGGSTHFTVGLAAQTAGIFSGAISFPTNDPDANPFGFLVTGTVDASAAAPRIDLRDGDQTLASGVGLSDFGGTILGDPLTRTYVVTNVGNANLILNPVITVPNGFVVASGFSRTLLNPGASASFTLRLTATTAGLFGGSVSFTSNDPNNNPFTFQVAGIVAESNLTRVVDDADAGAGFASSSGFTVVSGSGHQGGHRLATAGTGSRFATWMFENLSPGRYQIAVTWTPGSNRATNAPFTVEQGNASLATVTINQRLAPNDFQDAGSSWKVLGRFDLGSGSAIVRLTNAANGVVVADAVRLVPVGLQLADNDDSSFQTTGFTRYAGSGFHGSLHAAPSGNGQAEAVWTFSGLTPGTYRLAATWTAQINRATNAPFTIRSGSNLIASIAVNQRLAPNDFQYAGVGWRNLGGPFVLTGTSLTVRLTNAANGWVIADALRLERISN
ncbi:hypothetical protein Isop_3023 [Isosphaera pallida ATCC 43644]|uniref:Choice-of-anchor D domain-containing protein n=1 Tax=Isosphaera pallida (strain ATCC 43644 / DSM 9630 / IS1B) TaxID=575540 RepID=E8R2U1_ISOPI|nr:choice-of-anchor D domain-containing protein [Isosphaera pallida]ADV63588.1 hypothetical protein Isop_3023 [Isosphaera pallida ATCC 43644]